MQSVLLNSNLRFEGGDTRYLTHGIHPFAARFPPQLPRHFIETLTRPGDIVLDPMAGSGTTLLEAGLLGRIGIGVDVDPLAVLISDVKSSILDPISVGTSADRIVREATERLAKHSPLYGANLETKEILSSYDEGTREFLKYWFKPRTILELSLLLEGIARVRDAAVANALKVVFSSIIITKSGGVSLSRDLAHTRPHTAHGKQPRPAIPWFAKAANTLTEALKELSVKTTGTGFVDAGIVRGDAKDLPLPNGIVRLIVTSPPYAVALDYVRANKFSLTWLGYSTGQLRKLRGLYLGSEKGDSVAKTGSDRADTILAKVALKDKGKAKATSRYFAEMGRVIREMHRVLKPNGHAIIVVGPSMTKGIEVPTHEILAELGGKSGFQILEVNEREIDRDRRQLPISNHSKMRGIEARIHKEYVITLAKP